MHVLQQGVDLNNATRAPESSIPKEPMRVVTDIPQATRETPTDRTPVAQQPLRIADTATVESNRAQGPYDKIGFFPGMKRKQ